MKHCNLLPSIPVAVLRTKFLKGDPEIQENSPGLVSLVGVLKPLEVHNFGKSNTGWGNESDTGVLVLSTHITTRDRKRAECGICMNQWPVMVKTWNGNRILVRETTPKGPHPNFHRNFSSHFKRHGLGLYPALAYLRLGGAQGRKIRNELGKETVGGFVVCQLLMDDVVFFFRLETGSISISYHGFRRFQIIYFDHDFLSVGLKFSPVQSPWANGSIDKTSKKGDEGSILIYRSLQFGESLWIILHTCVVFDNSTRSLPPKWCKHQVVDSTKVVCVYIIQSWLVDWWKMR